MVPFLAFEKACLCSRPTSLHAASGGAFWVSILLLEDMGASAISLGCSQEASLSGLGRSPCLGDNQSHALWPSVALPFYVCVQRLLRNSYFFYPVGALSACRVEQVLSLPWPPQDDCSCDACGRLQASSIDTSSDRSTPHKAAPVLSEFSEFRASRRRHGRSHLVPLWVSRTASEASKHVSRTICRLSLLARKRIRRHVASMPPLQGVRHDRLGVVVLELTLFAQASSARHSRRRLL